MEHKTDQKSKSERAENHDRMLEEALARPGVREMMEVYGNCQESNRHIETYRSAKRQTQRSWTTDSSNSD